MEMGLLGAEATASAGGAAPRPVTRAARGEARAGAMGVAMPHPRALRTRPLRSSGVPPRAAPRGARTARRAPVASQPTQPSRDRRTQLPDARSGSSSASDASIIRGTSCCGSGRGVGAATADESAKRNRRNRRDRRFPMTAIDLRASNRRRVRRVNHRRRRGRGHPDAVTMHQPASDSMDRTGSSAKYTRMSRNSASFHRVCSTIHLRANSRMVARACERCLSR